MDSIEYLITDPMIYVKGFILTDIDQIVISLCLIDY